jgi:hypothetical protein
MGRMINDDKITNFGRFHRTLQTGHHMFLESSVPRDEAGTG